MTKMHEVEVDTGKNRIYLHLKGYLQEDELLEASSKVKKGIDQLKPGFDIINDISEFNPATQRGREIIKETQIYALQKKVNRVVRVVGNVIGQIQFDRSSREAGYTAVSVRSLEEAYDFLNNN